ncbi:MAG TPA: polyribonucleotide nucleotidyltransferase [Synergistaceae bacterium]|nr:polyribonucleotide nucleotidyltransferase [Synergistaceae bacterium]
MTDVFRIAVGDRDIIFEYGHLAKQANAAVKVSCGDTVLLVTTCMSEEPREGLDFFPLLVDYEERFYAAGKIPGGFIKREGRPSEGAILNARLIDRSIRSLFPEDLRNDVHVVAMVLSVDQQNAPSIPAINGASAALTISDVPWNGPVGAVRIGRIDGHFVVNPTEEEMANSELDLVVAGHADGITMVEAGAKEIPEDLMIEALDLAQAEIRKITTELVRIRERLGKPKAEIPPLQSIPEIDEWIAEECLEDIRKAVRINEKKERNTAISDVIKRALERFLESYPDSAAYVASTVEGHVKRELRAMIVEERRRPDGRAMSELRPISCEVGVLPRTHGSALFTRGQTQALVVTTLGMVGEDEQILDSLKLDEPPKHFMLHYNFPPFSVGEVRPMRGPGRREIGHGALAERAIAPLVPEEGDFPYIVRVVSDILESNGSSSMASVCGASMSLMDAGVPLKKACAGVAMGLIKEGDKVEILTDIQGLEDHYGDMDFKVAGTRDGITALQMDNKAGGIDRGILERALSQAKEARLTILDIMESAISSPRESLSSNAPRIFTMTVPQEKIREIIGPGGKTIRDIVQRTGVKINVEDDGRVYVAASSEDAAHAAIKEISGITKDVRAGEVYVGTVTRIMNFGAFVEVLPGKEGLLHVSEISDHRVPKVEDFLKIGDKVLVMIKEIDDLGRINLTRKRLLEKVDELELDEECEAMLAVEKEREESFAASHPAPRPSHGRGKGGDRRSHGYRRRDNNR